MVSKMQHINLLKLFQFRSTMKMMSTSLTFQMKMMRTYPVQKFRWSTILKFKLSRGSNTTSLLMLDNLLHKNFQDCISGQRIILQFKSLEILTPEFKLALPLIFKMSVTFWHSFQWLNKNPSKKL